MTAERIDFTLCTPGGPSHEWVEVTACNDSNRRFICQLCSARLREFAEIGRVLPPAIDEAGAARAGHVYRVADSGDRSDT